MVAGFLWGGPANFGCFSKTLRAHISESTTKYAIIWQIFFSDHIDQMCKFSSKSGGVPFQISFFSSFFFFRKNYLLLLCATSIYPSVRLSSVEIFSFRGNSLSSKPVDLKIGLNVREGVLHVRKA